MPFVLEKPLESPAQIMELQILRQFFLDYLNRFEAFQLFFDISKSDYDIAGQTRNTNTMILDHQKVDLSPLLEDLNVAEHTSIGGDFVIGYDFEKMNGSGHAFNDQIGLSIFDTANHGYEAFFLAGHIRATILNIIDQQIRDNREIDNYLFVDINELLKGPIAQKFVEKTNPVRATLTKGAVGIHGQLHRQKRLFNFVCTGLPLFYYSKKEECFFFLEPFSGPPLGYFDKSDLFFKPYVPHSIRLHPGDFMILASDGCFDSICIDDLTLPIGKTQKPIAHFRYPQNESMEVMHQFDPQKVNPNLLNEFADPAVQSFCHILEPLLRMGLGAKDIVSSALETLSTNPCFNGDDQSLIVVKVL